MGKKSKYVHQHKTSSYKEAPTTGDLVEGKTND